MPSKHADSRSSPLKGRLSMRNVIIFIAGIAAISTPVAAGAADKKGAIAPVAAPASSQPSPADVKRGVIIVKSFVAAINSDKVENERKGRYVACLFNNSVKTIGEAVGKIIAENPKLDANNPEHVFIAASGACNALPNAAKVPASGKPGEGR